MNDAPRHNPPGRDAPRHDALIIGGGLAGLGAALRLAESGLAVAVVIKRPPETSSSAWAQGGIAAAIAADDSPDEHAADTFSAGAGLCNRAAVDLVARRAPEAIRWLVDQGVAFTRNGAGADDDGELHLAHEGGHGHRRVVHAADATGLAVMTALIARVQSHPRITLMSDRIAVDLITTAKLGLPGENRCVGAYVLDRASGEVEALAAHTVVLATGGAAKVYLYATNPDTSTGDGIAMAWRAGCRVANLEFMQFHPTCLYHPHAKSVLLSETLRGEGGVLRLPGGERFMPRHDGRAELAPRDVVARAIDAEMKRGGFDCVYLDITHKPAEAIRAAFPFTANRLQQYGIDITRDPIPVVPAAHYTCGGVVTDLHGRTDVAGLYAIGECASTGLHGANRLASNSLLECVVFAEAAHASILRERDAALAPLPTPPPWDESRVVDADEQIVVSHNWDELRRFMWDYVGIVRTNKRLQRALHRVELLQAEIREFYSSFRVSNDLLELRNLALVAELTIRCALSRRESRGLHFNADYPAPLEQATDSVCAGGGSRQAVVCGQGTRD